MYHQNNPNDACTFILSNPADVFKEGQQLTENNSTIVTVGGL